MQNFIIAYDIFDKKRLAKVRKVAYSFALGGQKSALEAPLDKKLMKDLINSLTPIISKKDKVNIIKVLNEPIILGKASNIIYKKGLIIIWK